MRSIWVITTVIRLHALAENHNKQPGTNENLRNSKPRFRTLSLRATLAVFAGCAIFAGWWFRPYEIDETWSCYSSIRMQYKLHRDIRGRRIHVGATNLIDAKTNSIIATARTDGLSHDSIVDWWVGDRIYDYWRTDGTELEWEPWFQYLSLELDTDLAETGG